MEVLSPLEQAVLDAIALQVPEVTDALAGQGQVRVTARENTGAGFYTTLDVSRRTQSKVLPRHWAMSERLLSVFSMGWDFCSGFGMVTFTGWKAIHTERARLASILSE
jgi:ABC-type phosphate transport system auxiliary subunit